MDDPLFNRALLAIEESARLREQRSLIQETFDALRERLRTAIFDSASLRSESKAHRDDKED